MDVVNALPYRTLLRLARDKAGREHYAIVIKGTFDIPHDGSPLLVAPVQHDVAVADEYRGAPGASSLLVAHETALRKPFVDVVVTGCAYAPGGEPVRTLRVGVAVEGGFTKVIDVVGDRVWERSYIGTVVPSKPAPFTCVPIVFERAFGGTQPPAEADAGAVCAENAIGQGFYGKLSPGRFVGTPLPNLQDPRRPIAHWGDRTATLAFGLVSPSWLPRRTFAGTYDQRWLEEVYPLLPADFDERFEQVTQIDQQLPVLHGGEQVVVGNMVPDGLLRFRLPALALPATFMLKGEADIPVDGRADTIEIDCEARQVRVVWRASVPCRPKLYALRKVVVGERSARWMALQRSAKTHYPNLDAAIRGRRTS